MLTNPTSLCEHSTQVMKTVGLQTDTNQLLTIRQFCAAFPWPSESAMRAYVHRARELGIREAFNRVGRRVLVNPKIFFALITQLENHCKTGGDHETDCSQKIQKR